MKHAQNSPDTTLPVLTDENLDTLIDALRRDPEALAEVVSRAGPDHGGYDGWTPFAPGPRAHARVSVRTLGTFGPQNERRDREDV